jgi:hypothetical protein
MTLSRRWLVRLSVLILASTVRPASAEEGLDDVRALLAEQERRVKVLEERLVARNQARDRMAVPEAEVRRIVTDYLNGNPGAGMPAGVETGYAPDAGFYIRSVRNPAYRKWDDECAIPFSLGIRATMNLGYTFYKVTDNVNHISGQQVNPPLGDFSEFAVKDLQLNFAGTAFDPNLRYQLRLRANTGPLAAVPNTRVLTQEFSADDDGDEVISRASLGSALRLGSQTFLAYDLHPCSADKGCGPDCTDEQVHYAPTLTLVVGILRSLLGLEAYLGSRTGAVIERGIAGIFFGVPAATSAGVQLQECEDRFFLQAVVANAFESSTPNTNGGHLPGGNLGFWYDFGGNWNDARKEWDLFGTTLVDLEYSCEPVIRVGAGFAFEPIDSRTQYQDEEASLVRVMPAGLFGTRLIALLNGGAKTTPLSLSPFAVDSFDDYTFSTYVAGKYRGWNFLAEAWLRDLNDFSSGAPLPILYQVPGTQIVGLFPAGHGLFDYGLTLQGGYFVIPRTLQLGFRWSWVRGESGNVFGNGTIVAMPTVPGFGVVNVYRDAFQHYSQANEYTISLAYYFHGNSLKWQNDLGFYTGGNPAGSRSSAGFVPGADGWLVRSRLQLLF